MSRFWERGEEKHRVTEIIRWPQKRREEKGAFLLPCDFHRPRYFVLLKFPGHEAFYTKPGATFWTAAVTRRTDTAEWLWGSSGCVLWKIVLSTVISLTKVLQRLHEWSSERHCESSYAYIHPTIESFVRFTTSFSIRFCCFPLNL